MNKYKIVAWETDREGEPTGKERIFISDSSRKVARQVAYDFGGEARGISVYLPCGKKWFCRAFEKINEN